MPRRLAEVPMGMQGWPRGYRDVWEGAQEYAGIGWVDAGMSRSMQRCRTACPSGGIEAFPSEQTLCGVSVRPSRCEGRAGSQEYLPSARYCVCQACVCCTWLAGVASDHRRWSGTHQRPTQPQCPAKLPMLITSMHVSFDFTLWY